jgi:hypothetical protein
MILVVDVGTKIKAAVLRNILLQHFVFVKE